jgi:hypothetical protein
MSVSLLSANWLLERGIHRCLTNKWMPWWVWLILMREIKHELICSYLFQVVLMTCLNTHVQYACAPRCYWCSARIIAKNIVNTASSRCVFFFLDVARFGWPSLSHTFCCQIWFFARSSFVLFTSHVLHVLHTTYTHQKQTPVNINVKMSIKCQLI